MQLSKGEKLRRSSQALLVGGSSVRALLQISKFQSTVRVQIAKRFFRSPWLNIVETASVSLISWIRIFIRALILSLLSESIAHRDSSLLVRSPCPLVDFQRSTTPALLSATLISWPWCLLFFVGVSGWSFGATSASLDKLSRPESCYRFGRSAPLNFLNQ